MAALETVLLGAAVLGAAWGAVLVHEGGHYVMGRVLGVPAEAIGLRLQRPPHVALWQGGRWLSPDEHEYASVFRQHNPSAVAAWLFIVAGFLGETLVALILTAVFSDVGTLPWVIMGTSTVVLLVYVLADMVLSASRGRPYGDFSAMWSIARGASLIALAVLLLVRAGVMLLLAGM